MDLTSLRVKLNKIIDGHFTNDFSDSMLNVCNKYVNNSTNVGKRDLYCEIERREVYVNNTILIEYAKVRQKLYTVIETIDNLDITITDMSNRLNKSKTQTHNLISKTNQLKDESKKTEKKIMWVNGLINHYQLTEEENNILFNVGTKMPLTNEFLKTIGHIENQYENTKILLKNWYQTSAFDLMEIIGMQQEAAIEKLYRWTISSCRNIDSPVYHLVPKSLVKLQNRQVLYGNVIDEYCVARKAIIVQQFINALTQGTEGSKPIEFYAHDPKRYIGDILTWVYQVIPIEKENLSMLLKFCSVENKAKIINDSLIIIMEAICPLLKMRVEIILKPDKDPLVLWSITNLVYYYKDVIHSILPQGHMKDTLEDLHAKCEEVFLISLESKMQKDLALGVKAPPSDLRPSVIVTDLVSFLRDILTEMNTYHNINKPDKKLIPTHILDPLMQAINETACHLSSSDMSVYLLNCSYHIQCTLSLYTSMDEYNERLYAQSDAQIDTLTSEQASYLVANLNLGPIYTILQEKSDNPLSTLPGMDEASLKQFLAKFNSFLASPDLYSLPQLGLLLSHTHKDTVKKRAFEVIIAIYDKLYEAVNNPDNKYNLENIVMRSSEEVKLLIF